MKFSAGRWWRSFARPFMVGGTVHVWTPIGPRELETLVGTASLEVEVAAAISKQRMTTACALVRLDRELALDGEACRILGAVSNLLFLMHPGVQEARTEETVRVSRGAMRRLHTHTLMTSELGDPATLEAAVARHSLVVRLESLARNDTLVSFWAGQRSFVGRKPPRRLLAWPSLRNVRTERRSIDVLDEVRGDPELRRVVDALHASSPLTALLGWAGGRLPLPRAEALRWISRAEVARALVDRLLRADGGLSESAPRLAQAVLDLSDDKPLLARQLLWLLCHVQLVADAPTLEALRQRAASRDVHGLFLAARGVGLLPSPRTVDGALGARIERHAARIATGCPADRQAQLATLLAPLTRAGSVLAREGEPR